MSVRRRTGLALALVLLGLSQLATDCSGQVVDAFGYVELAGKPAVYAPLCAGDEVHGVRVYATPDPVRGGDFTLLWQAEGPTGEATRDGLIVLGDGSQFGAVSSGPPDSFPRTLSVAVDTARGWSLEERRERAADLPRYGAGSAVTEMTFDTARGRLSYQELRGLLVC